MNVETYLVGPRFEALEARQLLAADFAGAVDVAYTLEFDYSDNPSGVLQNDQFTWPGVPALLSVDVADGGLATPGEAVTFQVQLGGLWQAIPEDGMHATSLTTGPDGRASVYYFPADGLAADAYNVRAVLTGNPSVVSGLAVVEVQAPTSSAEIIRENPAGAEQPIPLVMIYGGGLNGADSDDHRAKWENVLAMIDATDELNDVDVWHWDHPAELPIGFNGTTGLAASFDEFLRTTIEPVYETPPIVVAYSQCGLAPYAFLNVPGNADRISGLIALGVPFHGSPGSSPDWAALIWNDLIGSNENSERWFDGMLSPMGMEWVGIKIAAAIDVERPGSIDMAWDNLDGAIVGSQTRDGFDVAVSKAGHIDLTPADMGDVSASPDATSWFSPLLKQNYGTLGELNRQIAAKDVFGKISVLTTFDDFLGDNDPYSLMDDPPTIVGPLSSWQKVGEITQSADRMVGGHHALANLTQLTAADLEGVVSGDVNFFANDGLVPIQSALLLDISNGQSFANRTGDDITLDLDAIVEASQLERYHVFSNSAQVHNGQAFSYDGPIMSDHWDLVQTPLSNTDYWTTFRNEILLFAGRADAVNQIRAAGRSTATYLDADGDRVTVRISGPGEVIVDLPGGNFANADELRVVDSTLRTTVTVTVRKGSTGDGTTTIGDILVEGSLNRLRATSTHLGKDLIIHGLVKDIRLANVADGHRILLNTEGLDVFDLAGRPIVRPSIFLGHVEDTTIDTGGLPLNQLRFVDWLDTDAQRDSITASSINQIFATGRRDNRRTRDVDESVAANFDADVTLTGAYREVALNRLQALGEVTMNLTALSGGVRTAMFGSLTGSLTARWVQSLTGRDNRTDGNINGQIDADLTLLGERGGRSLNVANVGAILGGTWTTTNDVRLIRSTEINETWSLDVGGRLGQLNSRGDLGGEIRFDQAGTIRSTGAFSANVTARGKDTRGVSIRSLITGPIASATVTAPGGVLLARSVEWLAGRMEVAFVGNLQSKGRRDNRRTTDVDESRAGDFGAALVISGVGAPRGRAIGNATFMGNLTGSLNLAGDVSRLDVRGLADGARVQATGSITTLRLGASRGSDFLVGVATDFTGRFATSLADLLDGADSTARIHNLQIRGWSVPRGTDLPRLLEDSHFTAGTFTTASVKNALDQQSYGLHGSVVRRLRYTDTLDRSLNFSWRAGADEPDSWAAGSPVNLL